MSLIRTLAAGGVDPCFTNPGTSEIHILDALDRIADVRTVLGLFEGVVTGPADGYARIAERPASTLLYLGPGFGNGLANLHNARRAEVPMIDIIGQHATYLPSASQYAVDAIEAIARPCSEWLRTDSVSSTVRT